MKARNTFDSFFDGWGNSLADVSSDETGSFDDNWIVSAGDLFGAMELPVDEPEHYYNEAA